MRTSTKAMFSILLLLLMAAFSFHCDKKSSTESDGSDSIVAAWIRVVQGQGAVKIIFTAGGEYQVDMSNDGDIDGTGDYTLAGDQITMVDHGTVSCTGPGVYSFNIANNTLTFTLVQDNCNERLLVIVGVWTRED